MTPIKPKLLTLRGYEQSLLYRQRWGEDRFSRGTVATQLGRDPETLRHWDSLLYLNNADYEAEHIGDRKPWSAYQVALLRKLDAFQYKGPSNPKANKPESDLVAYIQQNSANWTRKNWENNSYTL